MSSADHSSGVYHKHKNRLRDNFVLIGRRHTVPLLIIAASAAAIIHLMALRATPWLLRWWRASVHVPQVKRVVDDDVRVVVRNSMTELQPAQEMPPTDPSEPEQLEPEPLEIDLIDMDVKELVMAPGETNLSLQSPQQMDDPAAQQASTMAAPPAMSAPMPELGKEMQQMVPEPTPLNTNDVIVNATPQLDDVDNAEGLIEKELRRQAEHGQTGLPNDTRSLSELIGLSNLGASSGVARLGADFLFAFNESKLKNSARISLLQLAALIHKNPSTTFIIEGHTDGIGGDAYNEQLSMRRAAAVVAWLSGNGVPIDRVFMRACGSTRPLVSTNLPREKQALNRRVEIHMRRPGEVMPEGCVPAKK